MMEPAHCGEARSFVVEVNRRLARHEIARFIPQPITREVRRA
jgi:hypothetical protein